MRSPILAVVPAAFTIRRLALAGTQLANAYVGTIRLKLLKFGAVITRNTRRVRILLSSAYPYQAIFAHVAPDVTHRQPTIAGDAVTP